MSSRIVLGKPSWGKGAKKLVCAAAAAALSVSMMPAAAFATANTNSDGKVVYTLPTEPMAVQWKGKDASGNEYTYENLTVSLAAPPMQKPYYSLLGISNTALGRTIAGGGTTETEYGLFGSDANINPDEYLYNYCVSINDKTASDVVVPADIRSGTESTVEVSIDGTTYNMPRSIYTETNMLNVKADATSGDLTYAQWVEKENARSGRSKTTVYDPSYVSFSTNPGGTYKMVESMYSIAEEADRQIAASADANGNYLYRTRYASQASKDAEGTTTADTAAHFEDISKGVEYYVLSKVEKKKVAAVVCGYDPATKNYAVRILNPSGVSNDKDSNSYGGRVASAVNPIVTDMNELNLEPAQATYTGEGVNDPTYVKWYSPQQIVENCDAVFTCDAPGWNAVAQYLARASDGVKYSVYTTTAMDADGGQSAIEDNMGALRDAQAAAKSAGKDAADLCYMWPKSLFGVWYAQGCENVMMNFIASAYLYPEYFNLTDIMAWWAKKMWHITDTNLQDMVDSTCYGISLSSNESQIGTISDDYESKIDAMITEGNQYYLSHTKEVDAIHDGNLKTHNIFMLAARSGVSVDDAYDAAVDSGMSSTDILAQAEAAGATLSDADKLEASEGAVEEAQAAQKAAESAAAAAKAAQTAAETAAAEAKAAQKEAEDALATAQEAQKAAEDAQATAEAAQKAAEEKAAADVAAANSAKSAAENEATLADQAKREAEQKAADAEQKAAEAATAQQAAEDAQKAAEDALAAVSTITINKATVKASDLSGYTALDTVVLGAKTKKIKAKAFKGSTAKTVIVLSTKLKKAGVKNAFKGSKVATVQVPSAKKKAYKKIFTKKNCGKKVKLV